MSVRSLAHPQERVTFNMRKVVQCYVAVAVAYGSAPVSMPISVLVFLLAQSCANLCCSWADFHLGNIPTYVAHMLLMLLLLFMCMLGLIQLLQSSLFTS